MQNVSFLTGRTGLALLLALFSCSLPRTAPAGVDAEMGAYAGAANGTWFDGCSPPTSARVKYGGLGARARFHPLPQRLDPDELGYREPKAGREPTPTTARVDEDPPTAPPFSIERGVYFEGAFAVENRSFSQPDCVDVCPANDPSCTRCPNLPRSRWLGAGQAAVGYDAKGVGFGGGASIFPRFNSASTEKATVWVLPTLDLRLGRLDGFRMNFGIGTSRQLSVHRPGVVSIRASYTFQTGAELSAAGDVAYVFDDGTGTRVTLAGRFPFDPQFSLGGWGAMQTSTGSALPEGGFLVGWHPR